MGNRKTYQHAQYLKRKFSGLTPEKIKLKQLQEDQLRSKRAIGRHKYWLNRYLKAQPGLFVIFSDMAFVQKELICDKIRRNAASVIKDVETEAKMSLFVENSLVYSEGKKNVDY